MSPGTENWTPPPPPLPKERLAAALGWLLSVPLDYPHFHALTVANCFRVKHLCTQIIILGAEIPPTSRTIPELLDKLTELAGTPPHRFLWLEIYSAAADLSRACDDELESE